MKRWNFNVISAILSTKQQQIRLFFSKGREINRDITISFSEHQPSKL